MNRVRLKISKYLAKDLKQTRNISYTVSLDVATSVFLTSVTSDFKGGFSTCSDLLFHWPRQSGEELHLVLEIIVKRRLKQILSKFVDMPPFLYL